MTRAELNKDKATAEAAATALFVIILKAAKCREHALEGVAAITRDMTRNVNAFFDKHDHA